MNAKNTKEGLTEAINRAGGRVNLAKICHVKRAAVDNWVNRSGYIPYKYVLLIEKELKIPREVLRSDLREFFGK